MSFALATTALSALGLPPLVWLIVLGIAIVLGLIAVRFWLSSPPPESAPKMRWGYVGRPGSSANLKGAKFGSGLDVYIDNEGAVDLGDSEVD